MVATGDLMILTRWCRARRFDWMPAIADDGAPAVCLAPVGQDGHGPRRAGRDMLLMTLEDGFRLLDASGSTLATASDLPALLDALDGGISLSPRIAYSASSSVGMAGVWPWLRNSVESAIT